MQVGGKSVVCSDVTQNVVICEEHQKALKLLELLGIYYEMGNVIIFVDRQEKADEICGVLIKSGYACAPLHGGIDQADRDSNIVDFKNGSVKILVSTSNFPHLFFLGRNICGRSWSRCQKSSACREL